MHDRHFRGDPARLRSPDRVALLEVDRVAALSLEGIAASEMLEVGTGSGLFAEAFAERGLQVAGIDDSPQMLEAAREHVPAGHFRQARAEELPFPNKSFDVVFLGLILHETTDPVAALREARRVARQRVVILEWPYHEEDDGPPLEHRFRPGAVARLAREAGFQAVEENSLLRTVLHVLTP